MADSPLANQLQLSTSLTLATSLPLHLPPLTSPSPHHPSPSLHLPPLTPHSSLPLPTSLPLLLLPPPHHLPPLTPPPSPASSLPLLYSSYLVTTSLPSLPPLLTPPPSMYSPTPHPTTLPLQRDGLLAMLISQMDICQSDLTSSIYEAVGKDDFLRPGNKAMLPPCIVGWIVC